MTGSTPSTIAGQLNANGQVYLVNPNGVTITRSGQVNAAGFVASSLGISDEDFRAGRRQFRGSGASAKVANHGTITIGRGGYAALIGGQVRNTGTIAVPMGRVPLTMIYRTDHPPGPARRWLIRRFVEQAEHEAAARAA